MKRYEWFTDSTGSHLRHNGVSREHECRAVKAVFLNNPLGSIGMIGHKKLDAAFIGISERAYKTPLGTNRLGQSWHGMQLVSNWNIKPNSWLESVDYDETVVVYEEY
ncbi:hypothetical protein Tco_1165027 [Tanacetum coccineum]